MTKKNYVMLAQVISRYTKGGFQGQPLTTYGKALIKHLIHELCYELRIDNPRFNKEKFIDACYE